MTPTIELVLEHVCADFEQVMLLGINPSLNEITSGHISAIDMDVSLFKLLVYAAVEFLHPTRMKEMY